MPTQPERIYHFRGALSRTSAALRRGMATIGFIGGSITDPRPRHNWPEPVISWLVEQYPASLIVVENAAIGATGSALAVFRAERDLIDRGCDLVFVEFAVNDNADEADCRMRTREGLLRKLLADGRRDVVLVYTFCQEMYADMKDGRVPASIADFERLAEHYRLGSVWMGKHAFEETKRGWMRWEEWLPDGLHPTSRGSLSYAQSVIAYLQRELAATPQQGAPGRCDLPAAELTKENMLPLPAPLHPANWEHACTIPLAAVRRKGPWTLRRWPHLEWIDQVLDTSAVEARLAFAFRGRGLVFGFGFGKTAADFRYRLDGADWVEVNIRNRQPWMGDWNMFQLWALGDSLPSAEHTMELEVIHGNRPDSGGTNFSLGLIGVVP